MSSRQKKKEINGATEQGPVSYHHTFPYKSVEKKQAPVIRRQSAGLSEGGNSIGPGEQTRSCRVSLSRTSAHAGLSLTRLKEMADEVKKKVKNISWNDNRR